MFAFFVPLLYYSDEKLGHIMTNYYLLDLWVLHQISAKDSDNKMSTDVRVFGCIKSFGQGMV